MNARGVGTHDPKYLLILSSVSDVGEQCCGSSLLNMATLIPTEHRTALTVFFFAPQPTEVNVCFLRMWWGISGAISISVKLIDAVPRQ